MIALDTNILVYALEDGSDDARRSIALNLIGCLGIVGAVIPLPVIGELFNACRKRRIANAAALIPRIDVWMNAFSGAPAIFEDYLSAGLLSERHHLQYFDALILAISARAGAKLLLSEDMHDGLEVEGIKVINPFAAANETVLVDYLGAAL